MEKYLKQLVGFYPVSSNQDNVLKLLEYVKTKLESHGLHVRLFLNGGVNSLYASTATSKHSKVLLQAHVDVVPGEDQTFRKHDGRFYGRGVYDMLFATACYLKLLDDLEKTIVNYDISLMLSGDEEVGGFNGVLPFLEDGYTTDICILPDAGNNFGGLNISAKGISTHSIRVHGKSHHGSRPWEGDGAASKIVHFLTEAEKIFDTSSNEDSTMTISVVKAGSAANQGPSYADAVLDIRYKDKADLSRIKSELHIILQKYSGEITNVVEGDDYKLDTDNIYVKSFIDLYQKHHDKPIEFTRAYGSSDARFFSKLDIPVIMLRPDGSGAHGDDEWISESSIESFYKLLKEYVINTATIGDINE